MMKLYPVVCLLVCVFYIFGDSCVLCVRRDIARQLTRLEQRYNLDYTLINEEIDDLWNSIEQINTGCCSTAVKSSHTPSNVSLVQGASTFNTAKYHDTIRLVKLAFGKEKKYLREQWKDLQKSLINRQEIWEATFKDLSDSQTNLMSTCENTQSGIDQLREQTAKHSNRLDKLETKTEAQLSDMTTILNDIAAEARHFRLLQRPGSCMDLIKAGVTESGVYQLFYSNQPFIVYCLMYGNHGYTFISPDTYMNIDIKQLSNDQSHVIIRHRRTNGRQYHTRIEQITRYKTRNISVQYNNHIGYKAPVNTLMSPYVYVGINPIGGNQRRQIQGYKSNGKDIQFTNCDNNPNGYFTFLFNHGGQPLHNNGYSPAVARQWVDTASLVTTGSVPDKFMSKFELHFGGCGAYATNDHLRDVTMAAVGIPYKI